MQNYQLKLFEQLVAPARERGLKFVGTFAITQFHGRSREGAWIEILIGPGYSIGAGSLPRGSVD